MIRVTHEDRRPKRFCPTCGQDFGPEPITERACPECGQSSTPSQLLTEPRSAQRYAAIRRHVVGWLPAVLLVISVIPGRGDFLEPTTIIGRILVGTALVLGPALIFIERMVDLRRRKITDWVGAAVTETLITMVITIATVFTAAVMFIVVVVFVSLVIFGEW